MEKLSFELEQETFHYRRAILKYEEGGVKHEKEFVFFKHPALMKWKIAKYLENTNCLINLNLENNRW